MKIIKRAPSPKEMWDAHNSKFNWLSYWFPVINNDPTIPTPKTILVDFTNNQGLDWLEDHHGLSEEFMTKLKDAAKQVGYPVFMRTDESSGKFQWDKTCYVDTEDKLIQNLAMLIEENAMADVMGLNYGHIAIREYLHPEHALTAYHKMPVGLEYRFFADNGVYECHHPYWYPEILESRMSSHDPPLPENWRDLLAQTYRGAQGGLKDLEMMYLKDLAETVTKILGGYWSVDFLYAQRVNEPGPRWWLTDMALALSSHHKEDCPNRINMDLSYTDKEAPEVE